MAIALAVKSINRHGHKFRAVFTPAFSGVYVVGGDTLDLTVATDPKFLSWHLPFTPPESIEIDGAPGGFSLQPLLGAANNNSKLKAFGAGSGAATPQELTGIAYPAALIADQANIEIVVEWGRGV